MTFELMIEPKLPLLAVPEELTRIHKDISEWSLFDPTPHTRRINRLLRKPKVRAAYDKATRAAEAIQRWDSFRYLEYKRLSEPLQLLDGEEYLFPEQMECSDWRWFLPAVRPPLYYRFVCSRYCHWMAEGHRQLAALLFTDLQWDIISSERHTTAVCIEEKLLFDLTYAAMGVSVESALTMILGKDLQGDEFEYWPDDSYDCTRSVGTSQALEFWNLCDNHDGDKEQLAKELKQVIDGEMSAALSSTTADVAWKCGDLLADDTPVEV